MSIQNTTHRGRKVRSFAGFTLIELIVVITILVILGTIAFISLSGFSRGARDSVRISTISGMLKGLNISYVKTGKHPLPDSPYVSLVSSGATVGYQGYAGDGVVRLSGMKGQTTDPADGGYYTYSVAILQDRVQFLALLEESGIKTFGWVFWVSDQANAASRSTDYSARYPFVYGDILGILLSSSGSTKNQPIQGILTGSVDLGSGSIVSGYTAYLSGTSVSGTGISSTVPPLYNPSATCGSSNGGGFVSVPTTNLCAIGSSTGAVNSAWSWVWSCSASNGTRASCGGSVSVVSPAACGTATSGSFAVAPTTNLCISGTIPTTATLSGATWAWKCNDAGWSLLANCSATAVVTGPCSAPPSNAVFFNATNSYSVTGAVFGTSLTPSYYATPAMNTCQFKCGTGFGWDGVSACVNVPTVTCSGPSVTQTDLGWGHGSCAFSYVGSAQTLTVNNGNGPISIFAWGGGGGWAWSTSNGGAGWGGGAGSINAYSVVGGDSLSIYVAGGWVGDPWTYSRGWGGGGASYVMKSWSPILVAAGWGGAWDAGAYAPGMPGGINAKAWGFGSPAGTYGNWAAGASCGNAAWGGGYLSSGGSCTSPVHFVYGGGAGPGGAGGAGSAGPEGYCSAMYYTCWSGGYGGGGSAFNSWGGGGGYTGGWPWYDNGANISSAWGGGGWYAVAGGLLYDGSGANPGNMSGTGYVTGIGVWGDMPTLPRSGGNGRVYITW